MDILRLCLTPSPAFLRTSFSEKYGHELSLTSIATQYEANDAFLYFVQRGSFPGEGLAMDFISIAKNTMTEAKISKKTVATVTKRLLEFKTRYRCDQKSSVRK